MHILKRKKNLHMRKADVKLQQQTEFILNTKENPQKFTEKESNENAPGWIGVRGKPRFDHGRTKRVGPAGTRALGHHPSTSGKVGLLGDPSQHRDAVLEGRGVPVLRREPVPDGHDDGVAVARDAAAEGVVGGAVRGARDERAAVELHDHRQLPGRPRRREVPAVVRLGRGGGRDAVEAGAGAAGEEVLPVDVGGGRGEGVAAEGRGRRVV